MRSGISSDTRWWRWHQPFASILTAQNATEQMHSANQSKCWMAEAADRARLRARRPDSPELRASDFAFAMSQFTITNTLTSMIRIYCKIFPVIPAELAKPSVICALLAVRDFHSHHRFGPSSRLVHRRRTQAKSEVQRVHHADNWETNSSGCRSRYIDELVR